MSIRARLSAVALLALTASPAFADRGARELSAECAPFGCVPGDSGGYPITLTEPGSYILTSNLTTTNANQTLIQVNADNVQVDLNGFALLGPAVCSGSTVSCTGTGIGDGISASGRSYVTIVNGSVRGMGSDGIVVGNYARVEDVTITSNGALGVSVIGFGSVGGVFRRLSIGLNGDSGIGSVFGTHHVIDSTVVNNGNQGVFSMYCSQVLMSANDNGDSCTAIGPNRCSPSTDCD
ncbi:right-handed parallel beta-helix repeat-containing protein [Wenzhouxiangella sp. XN79A]|uniref:right-handed parallel beta-helix repeat-containing protein n=1 Tax=Wenzhouxiangella sp. XN79A TaxID=2724193 RepID=UPI00144A6D9F|nr:right-handed parallel beta-helix repeat-containing protein [Wenzhouxiangella sp. XN79A]NKI36153.1 right-handed parallel beta-helix repeat-containing protein [Wenzhouxiangella sp. XN79A]